MKKIYKSPEWDLIEIEIFDVILDSTIGEGGGQTGDPGDEGGGGFGDW